MAYFLTADGGTESLRARVYDLKGRCLGSRAVPYETRFAPGGRAEQDPADWWTQLRGRRARRDRGVRRGPGRDRVAIAYATTSCSVVALDENGDALRPALIWMDVRAGDEADAVLATGDPALALNGDGVGPVSAEWMLPKALWLKRHEPETFDRAHRICEYQDFLTFRLTGDWASSLNNVGLRWHHANDRGGPPTSLVEALDMGELLDKWPPRTVAPGEVVGTLCGAASEALGLPRRVKVVQGGADALIGMIGPARRREARPARADHRLLAPAVRRHRGAGARARGLGRLRRHRLPGSLPSSRAGRRRRARSSRGSAA